MLLQSLTTGKISLVNLLYWCSKSKPTAGSDSTAKEQNLRAAKTQQYQQQQQAALSEDDCPRINILQTTNIIQGQDEDGIGFTVLL
jgi:hypothetical protein